MFSSKKASLRWKAKTRQRGSENLPNPVEEKGYLGGNDRVKNVRCRTEALHTTYPAACQKNQLPVNGRLHKEQGWSVA
jgi:hypothetical protein